MWLWSIYATIKPVHQNVCYGTLQSEAMIANSHKAYFNELFNNDNIWIQSACTGCLLSISQSFHEVEQWKKMKITNHFYLPPKCTCTG